MAVCPMMASSKVNSWLYFFAIASNACLPHLVTSCPIPSPGMIRIFFFILFNIKSRKIVIWMYPHDYYFMMLCFLNIYLFFLYSQWLLPLLGLIRFYVRYN